MLLPKLYTLILTVFPILIITMLISVKWFVCVCVWSTYFRSDFQSLPFQAIECSLAHVEPVDGKSVGMFMLNAAVSSVLLLVVSSPMKSHTIHCHKI